jgi:hypothetical protein
MKVTTIKEIKFEGKWIEFTFYPPHRTNRDYDESCKHQYFWKAVNEAGLYTDLLNNGAIGMQVVWDKLDGTNYEIVEVRKSVMQTKEIDRELIAKIIDESYSFENPEGGIFPELTFVPELAVGNIMAVVGSSRYKTWDAAIIKLYDLLVGSIAVHAAAMDEILTLLDGDSEVGQGPAITLANVVSSIKEQLEHIKTKL